MQFMNASFPFTETTSPLIEETGEVVQNAEPETGVLSGKFDPKLVGKKVLQFVLRITPCCSNSDDTTTSSNTGCC